MSLVTADGEHLVNSNNYPDLFWALRGGGGGTFGVLTSGKLSRHLFTRPDHRFPVTYRTHPPTPFAGCYFIANRTETNYTNPNATQNILTELIRMTPSLVSQGYGGYAEAERRIVMFFFISPTATWTEANATCLPFFEYAATQAKDGGLTITNYTLHYPSFSDWYDSVAQGTVQVGINTETTSWLLPEENIRADPEKLSEQIMEMPWLGYYLEIGRAHV